jgi:iron(III) transport system ATP-binding protein
LSAYLAVSAGRKSFGAFTALDGIALDILEGEFICFLGPSGCGKTTLLRCIAGLESMDSGRIVQAGIDITKLPPSVRDFGIVFQSYALFPNLSVHDNIAYGLVAQGQPRPMIVERVAELVALVGLRGQETKYPAQLSGGQQQRVALARALAPMPGLLLLDEPLSALDAKVRTHLRRELRDVHRKVGLTTIMVTHDREEALTLADRIAVMNAGRIEQIGAPSEVYNEPATPFVADFIAAMNLYEATRIDNERIRCGSVELGVSRALPGASGPLTCGFKPEDASLAFEAAAGENVIPCQVMDIENLGSMMRVYLAAPLGTADVRIDVPFSGASVIPRRGERIFMRIPPESIRLYGPGG